MVDNQWAIGWIIDNTMTDDNEYFDTDRFSVETVTMEIENELEDVRDGGNYIDFGQQEYQGIATYKVDYGKRTFTTEDVLAAADHLETGELATLIENLYNRE